VNWRADIEAAILATLGSVVGVLAAERIPRRDMALVITAAVLAALLLLFTKLRSVLERPSDRAACISTAGLIALFGVGFWLGFIILDGATYLRLVFILMFHFDLLHANALKALLLVTTTLVPIAIFAGAGNIRWTEGLLMSAEHRRGVSRRAAHHARTRQVLGFPHSCRGTGIGDRASRYSVRRAVPLEAGRSGCAAIPADHPGIAAPREVTVI